MANGSSHGTGNGFQSRVAEATWEHAARHNKEKWDHAEQRLAAANLKNAEYAELEGRLDPFRPGGLDGGGLRRRRSMKESLRHLAELFATKYPKESDEVVQNLIAIFTDPVEQKLQGESDATGPADGPE